MHSTPPPHTVPSGRFACAQLPAPSHTSPWHGLPSLGHDVPPAAFTIVQPPMPLHVELASQLVGVHA
jgi:hypothetical protein